MAEQLLADVQELLRDTGKLLEDIAEKEPERLPEEFRCYQRIRSGNCVQWWLCTVGGVAYLLDEVFTDKHYAEDVTEWTELPDNIEIPEYVAETDIIRKADLLTTGKVSYWQDDDEDDDTHSNSERR